MLAYLSKWKAANWARTRYVSAVEQLGRKPVPACGLKFWKTHFEAIEAQIEAQIDQAAETSGKMMSGRLGGQVGQRPRRPSYTSSLKSTALRSRATLHAGPDTGTCWHTLLTCDSIPELVRACEKTCLCPTSTERENISQCLPLPKLSRLQGSCSSLRLSVHGLPAVAEQ